MYADIKSNSSRYISLYREPFHLNRRRVKPPAVELATSLWYEIVMLRPWCVVTRKCHAYNYTNSSPWTRHIFINFFLSDFSIPQKTNIYYKSWKTNLLTLISSGLRKIEVHRLVLFIFYILFVIYSTKSKYCHLSHSQKTVYAITH